MVSLQREFKVELPVGYTDDSGRVHREAWIRKMRGHEEALLSDPALSAGQLVTELIRSCLIRLGDVEPVDAALVSRLFTADRNYLLLEVRRITLGDRLLESYICPRCGSHLSVLENLHQLEVNRLAEGERLPDIEVKLEDGYVDRQGTLHDELVLTLPRGADEEFVAPMAEKNPLQAHDALMLRCIKRFGTLPKTTLEAYGVKILRDLTLGDRQRLQRALNDELPGVNFAREISCTQCGKDFCGVMDVSNFFVQC